MKEQGYQRLSLTAELLLLWGLVYISFFYIKNHVSFEGGGGGYGIGNSTSYFPGLCADVALFKVAISIVKGIDVTHARKSLPPQRLKGGP